MREVSVATADHPHARGENRRLRVRGKANNGPSPRAWGEPHYRNMGGTVRRTIPTRVGRTVPAARRAFRAADHPHARGENADERAKRGSHRGPSPRAWGEQSHATPLSNQKRTIPTRVGRTPRILRPRRQTADHPHARGENYPKHAGGGDANGPSPRAWGELLQNDETP